MLLYRLYTRLQNSSRSSLWATDPLGCRIRFLRRILLVTAYTTQLISSVASASNWLNPRRERIGTWGVSRASISTPGRRFARFLSAFRASVLPPEPRFAPKHPRALPANCVGFQNGHFSEPLMKGIAGTGERIRVTVFGVVWKEKL